MSLKAIILGILIALFFIGVFYYAIKSISDEAHERWEEEWDGSSDQNYIVDGVKTNDVPEDAFVFVRYREFVFPMRISEKRDIWDKMNRRQRNDQLEASKKAVKHGRVKLVWLEDNVCCFLPVSGDLVALQKDYKEFLNLGGKIEEA